MTIGDLLMPKHVILDLRVADKRRLIDELARRAAEPAGVAAASIADALNGRERLGSTGMGSGIAIPHARLSLLERPCGLFARLKPGIDFDAIDGEKVDLVFLLLLPAEARGEELNALACVARRLRLESFKAATRRSRDALDVYLLLTGGEAG